MKTKEDIEKWLQEEAKKNNMSVTEFAKKHSEELQAKIVPLGAEIKTTLAGEIKTAYTRFMSKGQTLSFEIDEKFNEAVDTVGETVSKGADIVKIGIITIIILFIISLFK